MIREKPHFNELEGIKDLGSFHVRVFVNAMAFYYEIDNRETLNQVLYCKTVIEVVVIPRFTALHLSF